MFDRTGNNGRRSKQTGAVAARACDRTLRAGAASYDRDRDLPALIRMDPFTPLPDGMNGSMRILARLERALRAERNKGRAGHWTYDLNRHIALRQAHLAEAERMRAQFPRPRRLETDQRES